MQRRETSEEEKRATSEPTLLLSGSTSMRITVNKAYNSEMKKQAQTQALPSGESIKHFSARVVEELEGMIKKIEEKNEYFQNKSPLGIKGRMRKAENQHEEVEKLEREVKAWLSKNPTHPLGADGFCDCEEAVLETREAEKKEEERKSPDSSSSYATKVKQEKTPEKEQDSPSSAGSKKSILAIIQTSSFSDDRASTERDSFVDSSEPTYVPSFPTIPEKNVRQGPYSWLRDLFRRLRCIFPFD